MEIQKGFRKRMKKSLTLDMTIEKVIADRLGIDIDKFNIINAIKKHVTETCEWFEVYDFIDIYISTITDEKQNRINEINQILAEEKSAYRIVNGEVSPLNSQPEIDEIETAIHTPFDSVNIHIAKALNLFSNRVQPDYENSIKESISAVEAMCCIITGMSGKNDTLGKTIKHLKDNGVHIHPAMESAFSSLYGYTSDEDGIRHGGADFVNATSEDAKYMLVSCSAFVNYLIEKWSKAKEDKNG